MITVAGFGVIVFCLVRKLLQPTEASEAAKQRMRERMLARSQGPEHWAVDLGGMQVVNLDQPTGVEL